MPIRQAGDVAHGREIGKESGGWSKYIYATCFKCGKGRWVRLVFKNKKKECRSCASKKSGKKNKKIWEGKINAIIFRIEKEFGYPIFAILFDLCEQPDYMGYYYTRKDIAGILDITPDILDSILRRYKLRPLAIDNYENREGHPTEFEDFCWFKLGLSPRRYLESCRWKTSKEIFNEMPLKSRGNLWIAFRQHGVNGTPWLEKTRDTPNTYWRDSKEHINLDRENRKELCAT